MTKDELFEEIRTQLNEVMVELVDEPWHYSDDEIERSIRSCIRNLTALGLTVGATMDTSGGLSNDLPDQVGLLLAYKCAALLIRGDLIHKLLRGQLGMLYRMAGDVIDTKTATNAMLSSARQLEQQYRELLIIISTSGVDSASSVFGGYTPAYDQ